MPTLCWPGLFLSVDSLAQSPQQRRERLIRPEVVERDRHDGLTNYLPWMDRYARTHTRTHIRSFSINKGHGQHTVHQWSRAVSERERKKNMLSTDRLFYWITTPPRKLNPTQPQAYTVNGPSQGPTQSIQSSVKLASTYQQIGILSRFPSAGWVKLEPRPAGVWVTRPRRGSARRARLQKK